MRFVKDLGLWAIDRSVGTCKFASPYCSEHCYNMKLYAVFKNMSNADIRYDNEWYEHTGESLKLFLKRRRKKVTRFRLCTRGEAIMDGSDVDRVKDFAIVNPDISFWIPTKAWRSTELRLRLEQELMPLDNVFLQASLDPSIMDSYHSLKSTGWSTTFFGEGVTPPNEQYMQCPKTWNGDKGTCNTCNICFSKNVDVWFKEH